MDKQKRDLLPDIVRGFAIILVVLAHCIQEGSGQEFSENTLYFHDTLYQFIYSFHMPLFMLISGYYTWSSVQKVSTKQEQWSLLKQRCCHLLIPIVAWTTLDYIYKVAIGLYGRSGILIIGKDYCLSLLTNFWFLWAVFYCFVVVWIMHFHFRDSKVGYLLLFLAMFWTPDGLGLHAYKYMMPFFLIGFYAHNSLQKNPQSAARLKMVNQRSVLYLVGSGIAFGLLFCLFDENSFIYLSGYKLLGKNYLRQLLTDGYRFLIGLTGSVFWILLWKELAQKVRRISKVLAVLGQLSMGIYILSGYIIIYGIRKLTWGYTGSYYINVIECVITIILSALFTMGIRKVKALRIIIG